MRYAALLFLFTAQTWAADDGWSAYGHDAGGTRYSTLRQITRENLNRLKVAWTYHTGALEPVTELNDKAAFEATPVLVDGVLYLTTPFNAVIALDPASGAEKWKYDPQVNRQHQYSEVSSRGVAVWIDSKSPAGAACRVRVFEGTIDARLLALDGKTGRPCEGFGRAGQVDLKDSVEIRESNGKWGDYQVTSAPTVVGDVIITGSSIGDNSEVSTERGVVRAYDARTGKLRWTWDPISWANQQKPRTGAANAWSTLAADPERDLVFVPTGSASPDYYGGMRPNDNRWANSVVALKASTGALVWGFQVVHHDLWDYDVASQPTLIEFRGKAAVAVTTKIGNLFVLDRETGKPLVTVEERSVPKSDIPGEQASATQPIPAWSPMVPQRLTADTVWGATPADREWCRAELLKLRNDGLFTPPSLQGSVSFPGNIGGVNWGSAAWDPVRHLLLANTNRVPAVMTLIPRDQLADARKNWKEYPWGGEFARQTGTPYAMHRDWLVSPSGLPCNAPPWGALVAFDLDSGKPRWESPLGTMGGGAPPGAISLGGPMATAGGLVFSAAALDPHLRAFDSDSGKELWSVELPASAQSTPMTYEWEGKQYLVICAGGHGKMKSKMGDSVVAFRLE
ncbi:MAG TPA: pyrroloquinoline quinone-dependent dehydrogenase [Bryobacteraceae bacterium]|nr:pyrroloquinoline quinone-dependent dehydrogenase [Bryobacteraceae bacterium]